MDVIYESFCDLNLTMEELHEIVMREGRYKYLTDDYGNFNSFDNYVIKIGNRYLNRFKDNPEVYQRLNNYVQWLFSTGFFNDSLKLFELFLDGYDHVICSLLKFVELSDDCLIFFYSRKDWTNGTYASIWKDYINRKCYPNPFVSNLRRAFEIIEEKEMGKYV